MLLIFRLLLRMGFLLMRTQQWDKVKQTIADYRKGNAVGNDYVFKDLWEDRVGT